MHAAELSQQTVSLKQIRASIKVAAVLMCFAHTELREDGSTAHLVESLYSPFSF